MNETKPETKPKNPFAVPGKTTVLLVPIDETDRERVLKLLEEKYPDLDLPQIVSKISLPRITGDLALFVLAEKTTGIDSRARKQPNKWELLVNGPVDLSGYVGNNTNNLESSNAGANYGTLIGRIATGIMPHYFVRRDEANLVTLTRN